MTVSCPACGASGVQTQLRDTRVTMENLQPPPLSYGRVYVCESCSHEWKGNASFVTVLVGGRGYTLDEQESWFLLSWLENAYDVDLVEEHHPELLAASSLIRALRVRGRDDLATPLELSDMQIEVLVGVLQDQLVIGSAGLATLTKAIRRFRGDPPFRSLE